MGRHSSPEQAPYLRSVAGWIVPWVLVAAVAVTAVVVGVSALGQQPIDARPPQRDAGAPTEDASPEATPSEGPSPSEEASPSPSPTAPDERDDDEGRERDRDRPLISEGVSVQVLNATQEPRADETMTRRLERLGFDVVAVVTAARLYDETTVFWSRGADRAAARALAGRFGWKAAAKPANLSASVDVHVVIGRDER